MRASFRASSLAGRHSIPKDAHDLEEELKGLNDEQVSAARMAWGRNEIPEKIVPLWYMILKQLKGPMPYMIEAATVLSAILEQWAPFIILISILIINTTIGFVEEKKAKDALDGLKNSMVSTVRRRPIMAIRPTLFAALVGPL
jgi:H+-transporting ATPase